LHHEMVLYVRGQVLYKNVKYWRGEYFQNVVDALHDRFSQYLRVFKVVNLFILSIIQQMRLRGFMHPIYMVRIYVELNLSPSENDRDLCHVEVLQFVESMRHKCV
jgi:hypothetical protein